MWSAIPCYLSVRGAKPWGDIHEMDWAESKVGSIPIKVVEVLSNVSD